MKIILEGTEAELRSALHSFGIPDKVVSDDGGNRREVIERTFAEFKATAANRLNNFCETNRTERPCKAEYIETNPPKFPAEVSEQTHVNAQKLYKAFKNIPFATVGSNFKNLKLSELIYVFAEPNGGD